MLDINKATLSAINTHITDSCQVKSRQAMREYLQELGESVTSEMAVNQRDIESQVREWRAHNFSIGSMFSAVVPKTSIWN